MYLNVKWNLNVTLQEPETEPSKELWNANLKGNFYWQISGGINGMQVGESAVRMRFPIWPFWQGYPDAGGAQVGESPGAQPSAAPLYIE